MRHGLLACLPFLAMAWPGAPAVAQAELCKAPPPPAKAEQVVLAIRLKRAASCYDIKAHPQPSLSDAASMLDKAQGESAPAARRQTVVALLELLRGWVQTTVQEAGLRDALRGGAAEAGRALAAAEVVNDAVSPTSWRVVESGNAMRSRILGPRNLLAPVNSACTGAPEQTSSCTVAIADFEAAMRSHTVAEAGLLVAQKDVLDDLADLFAKRARMWDAYRTEARPQYPWEWLLNGALYRDDRPKDAAGNPRGPANLPNGQVILLHPGVGLERFDARNTNQSSNNPVLYLEWLGYNRLFWDYGEGSLSGGLGLSLISVYAPRHDASDWSRGVIFWVSNRYGLAVTRNDDGTSIVISADLSELFRDRLNRINDSIRSDLRSK